VSKLRSYHFDFGNSTDGPIGYCARVVAASKKKAVAIMRRAIPTEMKIHPCGTSKDAAAVQYIEAYLNPKAISAKDIDDSEPA
jgi:hypothetical protein